MPTSPGHKVYPEQIKLDLLAAADYIQAHGLYQDDTYFNPDGNSACAYGAISAAITGSKTMIYFNDIALYPRRHAAETRLQHYLRAEGIPGVIDWSDTAPNAQTVIDGLRAAAEWSPEA